MKNKHITSILMTIGILFLVLGFLLAVVSTSSKNVVGGADIHTFLFVFFNENGGVYFYLSLLGIAEIIASVIVRRRSK